jgi:hypothetical protein
MLASGQELAHHDYDENIHVTFMYNIKKGEVVPVLN